jgi:flagellar hook assembly protein FlgD
MNVNPVSGAATSFDITTIRKVTYTLQPAATMNVVLTSNSTQTFAVNAIRSITFAGVASQTQQEQLTRLKSDLISFTMRHGVMPSISFTIDKPENVKIAIYTVTGRLVQSVAHSTFGAGDYTVFWNGLSARGQKVPAGSYLMTINRPTRTSAFKFVVIR